jgi:N-formylglutamate deformylase
MSHIVLHIPHSSRLIPDDVRETLCLTDEELDHELNLMTDHMTAELFELEGAARVVYPVSRLVIDPERFLDDEQEPMAKKGMGAVYLNRQDGKKLRRELSDEDRQALIDRYYKPHHQALEDAVAAALREHGKCVIIDCHSYPLRPLPYEEKQDGERPALCLGTDDFHTLESIQESALEPGVELLDEVVGVNEPFAGTIVPMKYWKENRRVQSIMIEVRRDLYWDGGKNCPSEERELSDEEIDFGPPELYLASRGWKETKSDLHEILKAIENCEIFVPDEEETSYCPFCGEFSSYPSDESCKHKLGFGNGYGGYLFLGTTDGRCDTWDFGNDCGDSWESMRYLACEHPDALEALERKFGEDPICKALIQNYIKKEDPSFPFEFCGEVYVGESHTTHGMASDYVETWYIEDTTKARDLIHRIDAMWDWLAQSGLME